MLSELSRQQLRQPLIVLSVLFKLSLSEDGFEFDGVLEDFHAFIRQFAHDDDSSALGLAFLTTSVSCIVDEYEKYDLVDLMPSDASDLTRHFNFDEITVFTSIVTMCSNELARVLELKSDQLILQQGPLAIIKSDRSFKQLEENFEWFADYAIANTSDTRQH